MEIINLDMTPSTVTPNAHAGQYDTSRTTRFMLKNGGVPFTLAGTETITAEITRSDNTEVTVNVANTSSNYVDVVFDDTVCTVKGLYACELRITDGGVDIGSQNFALLVQRDPYDGAGVVTETVGPADICTFETTLPEPLSVTVDVEATGGNGTPDSPNPIVGYTEANITRCGVNLWGGETMADAFANEFGYSKNTTTKTFTFKNAPASPYNDIIYDKFNPSTQYTLIFRYTADANNNSLRIDYTDGTSTAVNLNAVNDKTDYIFTTTSGKSVKSITLRYFGNGTVTVYYDESGLFEGVKTTADFTPYTGNTYTVSFGQTVYGGQLDVTRGKLTVTWKADTIGGINWTYASGASSTSGKIFRSFSAIAKPRERYSENNVLCSIFGSNASYWFVSSVQNYGMMIDGNGYLYIRDDDYDNDVDTFKTALSSTPITYELATPIDIDLTPEVISALEKNNVFADCGQTTVKYLKVE